MYLSKIWYGRLNLIGCNWDKCGNVQIFAACDISLLPKYKGKKSVYWDWLNACVSNSMLLCQIDQFWKKKIGFCAHPRTCRTKILIKRTKKHFVRLSRWERQKNKENLWWSQMKLNGIYTNFCFFIRLPHIFIYFAIALYTQSKELERNEIFENDLLFAQ